MQTFPIHTVECLFLLKRNQSGKEGVAERDLLLQSFLQVADETKAMAKAMDEQLYTFGVQFQWED